MKIKRMVRIRLLGALVAFASLIIINFLPGDVLALGDSFVNMLFGTSNAHNHANMTAWTSSDSLPNQAGEYYLTNDVTISAKWNVPSGTTKLCLNGYGIRMTGSGSIVGINDEKTLYIDDCGISREHYITLSNYRGIAVNDTGTETEITGGNGVVKVVGGYITGGAYSAFYISGSGSFIMNGGTVIGNSSNNYGAAVFMKDTSSFTMNGGSVEYNYTSKDGGAVEANNNSTVVINGGLIRHNVAEGFGGGIDTAAKTFTMNGGSIIENVAGSNGGGIDVWNGSFSIGGTVAISGNTKGGKANDVCLWGTKKITIADVINNTEPICVILADGSGNTTSTQRVITGGWSTYMDTADPADYFVSGNTNYVAYRSGNEVAIGIPPHIHDNVELAAWTSTNSLPTSAGNYYLSSNVTISSTWNVPSGTTRLCLNGHSITYTGSIGSVFYVGSGRTLNIYECDATVHYYNINNETYLAENINTVSGNYSFVGGYITGGMGYSYNNGRRGGAAYIQGGSVNIHGGAIIGNKATSGEGGGFYIEYGTLTMSDGYIVGNVATSDGGGLQVTRNNSGYFYMTGGVIANNTAFSHGGGLTAYNVADISGGSITGNQCFGGNKTYYKEGGGAIQIEAQGKLSVSGDVEISGNRSAMSGGGILVWGDCSYFRLSGNPVIRDNRAAYGGTVYFDDNIRLNGSKTINITGSLSSSVPIGVSVSSSSNNISGTGAFTSGWKDNMGEADPAGYFTSDNKSYEVFLTVSGEAEIGQKPVASITSGSNVNEYSSFTEALNNWSVGSTLKLMADVSTSSTVTVPTGEHTLDLNGYGIKMTGSGSVISVPNSAILNLYDSDTSVTHKFSMPDGAGLATLNELNGNRVINGGYITGGNAQPYGGGVCVAKGGIFNMHGGTIIGNNASSHGGGVSVSGSGQGVSSVENFKMFGGAISYNTATWGGGIGVYGNVYTYNGAVISNNAANAGGGGIELESNGRLYMNGATVTENRVLNQNGGMWKGAGIHVPNGSQCHISGNLIVKNNYQGSSSTAQSNVFVRKEVADKVIIGGALDDTAQIGIALQNGTGTFTTGWQDMMGDADPAEYFTSDDASYEVFLTGSGEANVGNKPVASITSGSSVNEYSSFTEALNNWSADSTLKLLNDVEITSTVTVSGTKTLDINGYGIKMTGSSGVIRIPSGADLTVIDSGATDTTHYYYIDSSTNLAVLAETQGAAQSGNAGKNGFFTGGYITGGHNSSGTSDGGGGISVVGKLTMTGGTVIGNYVAGAGGGICVYNAGIANLTGTSIIGNKTGNVGGGVDVNTDSGTPVVVLNHCIIRHNHAESNTGGIAARGGSVTLTDCDVVANSAKTNTAGIIAQNCHVTLEGVNINGNTTANSSNVYAPGITLRNNNYNNFSFTVKGSVTIADNTMAGKADDSIYIYNGRYINIGGALTNTDPIKIRHQNDSGTFTTGLSGNGTEANFAAYNSQYEVRMLNGEAYVGPPHTHNWVYAVSGNIITAACSGVSDGCCDIEPQTLTISAEGKIYDGSPVVASVSRSDGWTTENGLTVPEIVYSGNIDAGTYTASVTAEGKTAFAEFTISEKSMADEVSAVGFTGDYDGISHTITVGAPDDAVIKYGTSAGDYLFDAPVSYTNAGNYTVYYEVTRQNYTSVTGSAVVSIGAIDATVTVAGKTATVIYDGTEHTVSGYLATADTVLYDVAKDFSFTGNPTVKRTDVGMIAMGLTAEQFVNHNSNFATVTFNITDGSLTVLATDAVIKTLPVATNPVYTGVSQTLVTPGEVDGGTLYYAVGQDPLSVPDSSSFMTSIPAAKETGSYYVWYKVVSDDNHNDLSPVAVRVILAEDGWVTLNGTLYLEDGMTPVGDAVVTLMQGNRKVDYLITAEDGRYRFIVPAGVYSMVAKYRQGTQTAMIKLFSDATQDCVMSGGKTESHLLVGHGDGTFGVAVDGLDREARSVRTGDNLSNDQGVSVSMTVEPKTEATALNAAAISSLAKNKSLFFFDTAVEKTVDSTTTVINKTKNVLEMAVPYAKVGKRGVTVYYSDSSSVRELTESTSGEAGTFSLDKANGIIYIYSNCFATFAIGYTPYYQVQSTATLGSFQGTVTVTVTNIDGGEVFNLENVALDSISFSDIPKGQYTMTVTWTDGAENTLTVPLTIGDAKTDVSKQLANEQTSGGDLTGDVIGLKLTKSTPSASPTAILIAPYLPRLEQNGFYWMAARVERRYIWI